MVRYLAFLGTDRTRVLYDSSQRSPSAALLSAVVEQKANSAYFFDFKLSEENACYSAFKTATDLVTVLRMVDGAEEESLFAGYPTSVTYDKNNICTVSCEGLLATTNDIYLDYYSKTGTPSSFFSDIIRKYNQGRYRTGGTAENIMASSGVTVTALNNTFTVSIGSPCTVWAVLKKAQSELGGYFIPVYRTTGEAKFNLAWRKAPIATSEQTIACGLNLIDLKTETSMADSYTGIMPVGSYSGQQITLPNYSQAVVDTDGTARFGRAVFVSQAAALARTKVQLIRYDGATSDTDLLALAKADLASVSENAKTTTIKAADIGYLDTGVQPFHIFEYVRIASEPHQELHGTGDRYVITALEIDLLSPADCTVSVDTPERSLTQIQQAEADGNERTGMSAASSTQTYYAVGDDIGVYGVLLQGNCQIDDTKKIGFFVPLTMPVRAGRAIVGIDWARIIQGGQYTHGTTADSRIVPDASAELLPYGVYVTLTFSTAGGAVAGPCTIAGVFNILFQ